jgi:hypothetical protein
MSEFNLLIPFICMIDRKYQPMSKKVKSNITRTHKQSIRILNLIFFQYLMPELRALSTNIGETTEGKRSHAWG